MQVGYIWWWKNVIIYITTIIIGRNKSLSLYYRSFYSGLNSKIICESYSYCYIGCFDNGCTNVSLTCEINATCVIGCSNSQQSNLCIRPNGYARKDYPMLDYLYHVSLSYENNNDYYKLII